MQTALEYAAGPREYVACVAGGFVLATACALFTGATTAIATFYLAATMLLVTVIDARIFVIPDWLSLPAVPVGILATLAVFPGSWLDLLSDRLLAAAAASGFLYAVRHIHWRFRGIEGLGLGDVKLAAVAGAWLGLANLAPTLLLATIAALAAVLVHRLKPGGGAVSGTTRVPFGSFIAPAILGMWLWQVLQPWAVNLISSGGA
jgi:leader peptidase (prepilin peptidase)/N-methyltransferase